jgi:hypothetical protein
LARITHQPIGPDPQRSIGSKQYEPYNAAPESFGGPLALRQSSTYCFEAPNTRLQLGPALLSMRV